MARVVDGVAAALAAAEVLAEALVVEGISAEVALAEAGKVRVWSEFC